MFKTILNTIPRPWLIKISYWVRPFLMIWYKGNQYTDPIDCRHFRKFLPYGYVYQRANVLSPSTFSLERHRLLWLFLQRKTNFFSNKLKVLHIAPEQAFYKRFKKQENLEYITTDLSSPLADIKADICNLPFDNNSFDVVFCNHVLEHIYDDNKAIDELFRVIKPNGWGIFQVPLDRQRESTFEDYSITCIKERTRLFGQYDHLRVYGLDFFEKLKNKGFSVKKIYCHNVASADEIFRFRLDPNEILPLCYKNQIDE